MVHHAPTESLGLGVLHLYTEMGTSRKTFLIRYWWQRMPTDILLESAVENQVLEMSLFGSIWINSRFPTYSNWYSDHAWLIHICAFNNKRN